MTQERPLWGTKAWFDDHAKESIGISPLEYYSYRKNGYQKVRIKTATEFVVSSNNWPQIHSLLDVGCATGDLLGAILACSDIQKVVGVDFSDKVITLAQKNFPHAEFYVDTYPGLCIKERYDAVLIFEVLYYLSAESRLQALIEIKNLLNENGCIYFSSSVLGKPYLTESQLMSLVNQSGLTIQKIQRFDYRNVFRFTTPLEKIGRVINESDTAKNEVLGKKVIKIFLGNIFFRPLINLVINLFLRSEFLVGLLAKKDNGKANFIASHVYLELKK